MLRRKETQPIPNVSADIFGLTGGKPLMYYPQVGLFYADQGSGRLLKLVDRADLGSVGDEP